MKPRLLPLMVRLIWVLVLGASTALKGQILFQDDFESGLDQWTSTGTWGLSAFRSASPARSVADSPGGFYSNDSDTALEISASIDLSGLQRPMLAFNQQLYLEADYDFARVELSVDGGATWAPLESYSGLVSGWQRRHIDLSGFIDEANVAIRFRLITDASVAMEGWFIDDVVVGEAPAAVTLHEPEASDIGTNSIALNWSQSAEADFAAYRIYRSRSADFSTSEIEPLAEITDATQTDYSDISCAPKTRYYYVVDVVTNSGLASASNTITAVTSAGMDYPFLVNGEGGPATWVATAPWGLSDEDAHSGGYAWTDSPNADYADNIASQALTLAAPVDLSAASSPVFSFVHRHAFASGDTGNVELSTDDGGSWTLLEAYANNLPDWRRERFDLSAYAGEASVLLRFRLTTDASNVAEGWLIDDISLAEAPTGVPAPAIDQIGSDSLRLTWSANTDPVFAHYAIHRDSLASVDYQSPRVGVVTDQNTTEFFDTGLAQDSDYHYRIYAVSPHGAYSPTSANSSPVHTLNNPIPFFDDFSGGLQKWNLTGTWGLTDIHSQSGAWSLSDSPGTVHQSAGDSTATLAVDLSGSEWPVLRFHERYDFGVGDRGYLEVSTNGSTWTPIYSVRGAQADWTETGIDLSAYRDQPNLRIQFRILTNSDADVGEGWYLDSVSIGEHTASPVSLPFREDFSAGLGDWITGGWSVPSDAEALLGGQVLADSSDDAPWSDLYLHLGREVDLTGSVDPQLVFWYRGNWAARHYLRLGISQDGGLTWQDTAIVGRSSSLAVPEWTRVQHALDAYTGQRIRVRLHHYISSSHGAAQTGRIDAFTIQERPAAVEQHPPVPAVRSVALSWSPSELGAAFARYEVYRHSAGGVTPAHTLVASLENPAETSFTDTELAVGESYYYAVFVVNQDAVYSNGAERQATTVPVSFPFADTMDDLAYWTPGGDWGIQTAGGREGGNALASNPAGDYALNEDTNVLTAVDLSGSEWPVLRFHERYDFGTGDRGYLEVSTNGSTWIPLYSVRGVQADWTETGIDLSAYRDQANLRIRFRILANSDAEVGDGWRIDDLSIDEHGTSPVSLPVNEDFSAGLGDWITGGWSVRPDAEALLGGHVLADSSDDAPWSDLYLHLGHEVDLTGSVDPQLVFWYRGNWAYRHYLRLGISQDGGLSWQDTPIVGGSSGVAVPEWTRVQHSLADYTGQRIRVRLHHSISSSLGAAQSGRIDAFTIQERPAAVEQHPPVPAVRSVALTWSPSELGAAFARYEVYRHSAGGVTPAHTLVATIENPAETSFTDTGLAVGESYYYSVFVVNQDAVYSDGAERQATTVPVSFPFADTMDDLAYWTPGGDWGIQTAGGREGGNALASNPAGDYAPNEETNVLTAVDLSGSEWPVLRFHESYDFGVGDRGYLEVSINGSTWTPLYSVRGVQADWTETGIDLSAYRDQANLRIRFRILANSDAELGDGWRIDDLSIAEHTASPVSLPFHEDFSAGLSDWITGGWSVRSDAEALLGGQVLADSSDDAPWSDLYLHLGREVDLTGSVDPQLVFWYRGNWAYRHYLRLGISQDGGLSWQDSAIVGRSSGGVAVPEWTRVQQSLADYTGQSIRVRLHLSISGSHSAAQTGRIDGFTIQERPAAATLEPASSVGVASIGLEWEQSPIADFAAYRIYRGSSPSVNESDTLIGEITDPAQTQFTDTGLQARTNYHYRIYTVNTSTVSAGSNTVSATTLALEIPWQEDFTAGLLEHWTVDGSWQVAPGLGLDDAPALVDSVGDYAPNTNTSAQTALDLSATTWPVLEIRDRHDLGSGDDAYLEVSTNNGSSWTTLYALRGTRNEWSDRRIDLSPYRHSDAVWLRLRLQANTDSSVGDGWRVDHLAVTDHAPTSVPALLETFEAPLTDWFRSGWHRHEQSPFVGTHALRNTADNGDYGENTMVSAHEIDLSATENPQLTYWLRAELSRYYYFYAEVSTDDGLSWTALAGTSLSNTSIPEWTRYQVDLSDYRSTPFRLRFRSSASGWRTGTVEIDRIGLGGQAPGAPGLLSPSHNETVEVFRPVLTVSNVIDYQNDPLNYRFEVYADAELTQLVAQVPSVASGTVESSWQVDVNLVDNAPYWWRVRAFDAENTGDWSDTGVFNVNESNTPPDTVTIAGPPNGTLLLDLDSRLFWYPTHDPDVGDSILDYHLQVALDAEFQSILVDVSEIVLPESSGEGLTASVRLRDLPGSDSLQTGAHHWRIRARDTRYSYSNWSEGMHWFEYPSPLQFWRYNEFTNAEYLDASVSDPLADANRDGIPNLLKFLHGLGPFESRPGERPQIQLFEDPAGHVLGIDFDLRRDHGLDLHFEASTDLSDWSPASGSVEIIGTVDANTDRARFLESEPSNDTSRFLRIRVDP